MELKEHENGIEYLEFSERLAKTRTGEQYSRAFRPKKFAVGGDRCPINLHKEYKSHRV